jgi:hypothetical protein
LWVLLDHYSTSAAGSCAFRVPKLTVGRGMAMADRPQPGTRFSDYLNLGSIGLFPCRCDTMNTLQIHFAQPDRTKTDTDIWHTILWACLYALCVSSGSYPPCKFWQQTDRLLVGEIHC